MVPILHLHGEQHVEVDVKNPAAPTEPDTLPSCLKREAPPSDRSPGLDSPVSPPLFSTGRFISTLDDVGALEPFQMMQL